MTTMESTPASASSKLPYEILAKIFINCLPPYPLTELQPNAKIAPMLLCHVCSFWRAIALSCTTLWSHLYFELPIVWDPQGRPFVWGSKSVTNDMELIRWWRKNQGSIPPFLRLGIRRKHRGQDYQELPLDGDFEYFLLDYMSSAQYLDVDLFYRYLTVQAFERGFQLCPNLHTLKTQYSMYISHRDFIKMYDGELYPHAFIPFCDPFSITLQLPPTLRRLSLHNNDEMVDWISTLSNWPTLTHLSLNIECTLSDWFSLIRGISISGLEWGHFYIILSDFDEDISNHAQPHKFSLPNLSNLFLYFGNTFNESLEFPLHALFDNLELPALQDLHLSTEGSTWWDSRAAMEILSALKGTPALTKLTLGSNLLVFESARNLPIAPVGTDVVCMLSSYAPHLAHLQLQLMCRDPILCDMAELAEQLFEEIFRSREWLDLKSPTNTIREVTIVIEESDPAVENALRDSLVSALRKNANKADNVTFEIARQPGPGQMTVLDETLKTWATVH